ncbi:hypothetical protein [Fundidesulfovibrio soli]|uniref:hypothetical protein n=1 Tax=Fundidesulfovibrio soli TaxID=2922716 RepID=UPI001FAF365E|nr:hypothetical protein [Fundidesulfovibrio soli]
MTKIGDRLKPEKPWAILGISRKRYESSKPWKGAKISREQFEQSLRLLPNEIVREMKQPQQLTCLLKAC